MREAKPQEEIAGRLQTLGETELADVVTFVGYYDDWACDALWSKPVGRSIISR